MPELGRDGLASAEMDWARLPMLTLMTPSAVLAKNLVKNMSEKMHFYAKTSHPDSHLGCRFQELPVNLRPAVAAVGHCSQSPPNEIRPQTRSQTLSGRNLKGSFRTSKEFGQVTVSRKDLS